MRYLTKEWYLKCQTFPMTPAMETELEAVVKACQVARKKEALPDGLLGQFAFHDGDISQIEVGKDCIFEVESPDYGVYRKVVFQNAVVEQELPPLGAIWLYEEVYRRKSGDGYEVHVLSFKMMDPNGKAIVASNLFETKIICRDILFG